MLNSLVVIGSRLGAYPYPFHRTPILPLKGLFLMKMFPFFQDKFEETVPEYREALKVQAEAARRDRDRDLVNPEHIELLVDFSGDWYAM